MGMETWRGKGVTAGSDHCSGSIGPQAVGAERHTKADGHCKQRREDTAKEKASTSTQEATGS